MHKLSARAPLPPPRPQAIPARLGRRAPRPTQPPMHCLDGLFTLHTGNLRRPFRRVRGRAHTGRGAPLQRLENLPTHFQARKQGRAPSPRRKQARACTATSVADILKQTRPTLHVAPRAPRPVQPPTHRIHTSNHRQSAATPPCAGTGPTTVARGAEHRVRKTHPKIPNYQRRQRIPTQPRPTLHAAPCAPRNHTRIAFTHAITDSRRPLRRVRGPAPPRGAPSTA
jgi:hypothetical protein